MTTTGVLGVYAAQRDTFLLGDVLAEELVRRGTGPGPCHVLELGTGSGALAVAAARAGATSVTAVDISRRAVIAARLAARRAAVPVRVHRGDLTAPVHGRTFDVVLSNPPYVPAERAAVPRRGRARAWDAGLDGRAVLDRLCVEAPRALAPGGVLLLVQSGLSDVGETRRRLERAGLTTDVAAACTHPLGPILRARRAHLRGRGLLAADVATEDLVVIRGSA